MKKKVAKKVTPQQKARMIKRMEKSMDSLEKVAQDYDEGGILERPAWAKEVRRIRDLARTVKERIEKDPSV